MNCFNLRPDNQLVRPKRQMRADSNETNTTPQEQQIQARFKKVQRLFFEKKGSIPKNNCYEVKLPTIPLYFS